MLRLVRPSVLVALLLSGCSRTPDADRAPVAARPPRTTEQAPVAARADPDPPPASAPFELHEWGLLGTTVGAVRHVEFAAGVSLPPAPLSSRGQQPDGAFGAAEGLGFGGGSAGLHDGRGVGIGKPVLYAHLDPGVDRARFSLTLRLRGGTTLAEHWPPASAEPERLHFADVLATRGACRAPLAPPTEQSEACRATPDHFCEAAEIPRYQADRDVCLTVGANETELLFYRATAATAPALPVTLERVGEALSLVRAPGAVVAGPVLLLSRDARGRVSILDVAGGGAGPIADLVGTELTVEATRQALLAAAIAGGLTALEADAFVDAWAPAYFDRCRRRGPEAHGHIPLALAQATRSLLYIAPRTLVDALLPLATEPPARAIRRVFLVRVLDEQSIVRAPARTDIPNAGHGTLSTPGGEPWRTSEVTHGVVRPQSPPTVTGGLPAESVRRVVMRNLGQFVHCYDLARMRHPSLSGRVALAWELAADGVVTSSVVQSSSVRDPDVGDCMASVVRRWAFPTSDPPGPVSVRFAFLLEPPPPVDP